MSRFVVTGYVRRGSIICNQSAYRLWLLSKGKYLHWISNAFMYVQLIVRNVSHFFIFYFFFYRSMNFKLFEKCNDLLS